MKVEIADDADTVARRASAYIAAEARAAIAARGRFNFAVSGGRTPWQMLRNLARERLSWQAVHLFQVDERVTAPGDPDRNLTHIAEDFLAHVDLPAENLHAMPVERDDLAAAAAGYAAQLRECAGSPPVLDLVHLGLGPDGHTASLVPGDAVLQVGDADVALTGSYQGHRRMTLTFPMLDRARRVLWLVTGADKCAMLKRLRAADASIPAGRVEQGRSTLLTDRAAAGLQ